MCEFGGGLNGSKYFWLDNFPSMYEELHGVQGMKLITRAIDKGQRACHKLGPHHGIFMFAFPPNLIILI